MEIKILLFANDELSKKIYSLLQDDTIRIVGKTDDENKILEEINKLKPNIVLICSENESLLFRISQQIYLLRPKSIPIIITNNYSADFLQKVMQIGINYVLPINLESTIIIKKIKSISSNETIRLNALENSSSNNYQGKVLTAFSSKGGVGKTTLVTNLAVKLAKRNKKVAILDLDLEFGEIAYNMRIDNKENIVDLLQEEPNPNADTIRKYMGMHSSGVNILAAPSSPEFCEYVSTNQIEKIISNIRTFYDYVIIDTALGFNSINLACFDLSTYIIITTEVNLSSLRRTKKALSILTSLVGEDKVKLVISKDSPGRLKERDILKAMEYPIFANVGYDDKKALEALNLGLPISVFDSNSKLSKGFDKLTDLLDGKDREKKSNDLKKTSSIFSKLRIPKKSITRRSRR